MTISVLHFNSQIDIPGIMYFLMSLLDQMYIFILVHKDFKIPTSDDDNKYCENTYNVQPLAWKFMYLVLLVCFLTIKTHNYLC